MTGDQQFEVRLDADDYRRLEESLRGRDMTEAYAVLARLADNRTKILVEIGKTGGNVPLRDFLQQALTESRLTEAQVWDTARRVEDSLHAAAMRDLNEASNTIAGRADQTAKSLRNATVALVIMTAVLAAATIVLVVATFQLKA